MRKLDDIFPHFNFPILVLVITVIAMALQLSGAWVTMLIAGALGALLARRHRTAFLAGFIGVAIAWLGIFVYLSLTAQALVIAEFFIGLLGLSGMGWLVIVISVILGALLGGFGGLLGRSVVDLVDELIPSETNSEAAPVQEEQPESEPEA
ncbi:MAG: hypothetical protein KAU89_06560 [Candidatus Thorarchaeota archaeon]|jgi:hypothetical protein|nr:hypothetical protein [Candidatus Thorarchaeota archaeon]